MCVLGGWLDKIPRGTVLYRAAPSLCSELVFLARSFRRIAYLGD